MLTGEVAQLVGRYPCLPSPIDSIINIHLCYCIMITQQIATFPSLAAKLANSIAAKVANVSCLNWQKNVSLAI